MSFANIKLQNKAIDFIKRAIKKEKLPHSLLFFGPDSIGKKLTALTLAKALNCENNTANNCCDQCPACKKIDKHIHPDVALMGPEDLSNAVKISSIRAMQKKIVLKPFEGKAKVFIIDRSHLLTEEAANSLLKILEEPPRESFIILITDQLGKLFPTVRSRCQWVLFSQSKPKDLKEILIKEKGLIEAHAHFLSHLSEGRIGKAILMKEDDALEYKNKILDGFTQENIILKEDPLFFNKKRVELLHLLDVLISWYRDMLILKSKADDALVINADRIDDLKRQSEKTGFEGIKELLADTIKTRKYLEQNVNPKLALASLVA